MTLVTATRPPATAVIEVRESAVAGRGVFATAGIPAGTCILELRPEFTTEPDRHTVQLAPLIHKAFTGDPDGFINHSCRPTAAVDVDQLRVVSLVDLLPGDEVTFDYRTTEWDMVEPFVCRCDGRARWIRGFRHTSPRERARLAPLLPAWLAARAVESSQSEAACRP